MLWLTILNPISILKSKFKQLIVQLEFRIHNIRSSYHSQLLLRMYHVTFIGSTKLIQMMNFCFWNVSVTSLMALRYAPTYCINAILWVLHDIYVVLAEWWEWQTIKEHHYWQRIVTTSCPISGAVYSLSSIQVSEINNSQYPNSELIAFLTPPFLGYFAWVFLYL